MHKPIYYIKELLKIAFPIILGNVGFIFIGIGDVIVAGRHSTDTFAAISLAAAIVNCIMTLAIGLTASISPLLSNYNGEGKPIKRYFYPSIRFALWLAGVSCILILLFIPIIPHIGFEQKLVKPIARVIMQFTIAAARLIAANVSVECRPATITSPMPIKINPTLPSMIGNAIFKSSFI